MGWEARESYREEMPFEFGLEEWERVKWTKRLEKHSKQREHKEQDLCRNAWWGFRSCQGIAKVGGRWARYKIGVVGEALAGKETWVSFSVYKPWNV